MRDSQSPQLVAIHPARVPVERFVCRAIFIDELNIAPTTQRIATLRSVVDAHGCRLTTAALTGDGWRVQLKWVAQGGGS